MSAEARKRFILAVLLVVMAALWYRVWRQTPSSNGPTAAAAPETAAGEGAAAGVERLAAVNLEALDAPRPEPAATRRNLFQYGGAEPVADTGPVFVPPPPPVTTPAANVPAQPAVSLKLIGVAQPRGDSPRVAILSDERGVYHGTEGTIIEGRYRIVRVDARSVELTTLDGSGLFVLRLPPS